MYFFSCFCADWFFYFTRGVEAKFDADEKRFMARFSLFCLLAGSLLLSYGVLYLRKSQQNLTYGLDLLQRMYPQRDQLEARKKIEANMNFEPEEIVLKREINMAEENVKIAQNFSKYEDFITWFAASLLVVGTVLQAIIT
jgi:hypothetical protein